MEMEFVPEGRTLIIVLKIAEAGLLVFVEMGIVIQVAKILTIVPKIVVEEVRVSAEMDIVTHLVRIPITALKTVEVHLPHAMMNVLIQDKDAALERILIKFAEIMIQIPA